MIPDPIEKMEDRAERLSDDLYHAGYWHCYLCGEAIKPGHEQMASPDPASAPICDKCLEKMLN